MEPRRDQPPWYHGAMEPRYITSMLRLLAYSWEDAGFEYDGLTDRERELVTQGEFDDILRQMFERGIIDVGQEEEA